MALLSLIPWGGCGSEKDSAPPPLTRIDITLPVPASPEVKFAREDWTLIRETHERLQKEALDALPVDEIKLGDGRVRTGKIIEETGEAVSLERRLAEREAGRMNLPLRRNWRPLNRPRRGTGCGSRA